jgi:hypothetical protein
VSRALVWTSVMALGAALAGCGGDEAVAPTGAALAATPDASLPSGDAGATDAGAGGAGGAGGGVPSAPDAGPKKREVYRRNPFGNVAATNNLLWDGDFEWASAFSDQYGWIDAPVTTLQFTSAIVGADCRSGLKCARVKKGGGLYGIGVTTRGAKLAASFWAKPKSANASPPSCKKVSGALTSDGAADADAVIPPVAAAPDASGWCEYRVVAPPRQDKTYLYIRNDTGTDLVVDDAVLVRAPIDQVVTMELRPPTPEDVAAHAAIVEDLRKLPRGPYDPPPNAARRAFERVGAP